MLGLLVFGCVASFLLVLWVKTVFACVLLVAFVSFTIFFLTCVKVVQAGTIVIGDENEIREFFREKKRFLAWTYNERFAGKKFLRIYKTQDVFCQKGKGDNPWEYECGVAPMLHVPALRSLQREAKDFPDYRDVVESILREAVETVEGLDECVANNDPVSFFQKMEEFIIPRLKRCGLYLTKDSLCPTASNGPGEYGQKPGWAEAERG